MKKQLKITLTLRYPKKFMQDLGWFTAGCIKLSKMEYPFGKKEGEISNSIWRVVIKGLAIISAILYLVSGKILRIIFKENK